MKDFDFWLLMIVGSIVAILIFFGIITTIQKSMKPSADLKKPDTSEYIREQEKRLKETETQYQQLMEQQQQKLRDYQRNLKN